MIVKEQKMIAVPKEWLRKIATYSEEAARIQRRGAVSGPKEVIESLVEHEGIALAMLIGLASSAGALLKMEEYTLAETRKYYEQ